MRFLRVTELARLADCHEDTVRRAITAGRLRVVRIGHGRAIRIREEDVKRFIRTPTRGGGNA